MSQSDDALSQAQLLSTWCIIFRAVKSLVRTLDRSGGRASNQSDASLLVVREMRANPIDHRHD